MRVCGVSNKNSVRPEGQVSVTGRHLKLLVYRKPTSGSVTYDFAASEYFSLYHKLLIDYAIETSYLRDKDSSFIILRKFTITNKKPPHSLAVMPVTRYLVMRYSYLTAFFSNE